MVNTYSWLHNRIVGALRESISPLSIDNLVNQIIGYPRHTIRGRLSELVKAGRIQRTGRGIYTA